MFGFVLPIYNHQWSLKFTLLIGCELFDLPFTERLSSLDRLGSFCQLTINNCFIHYFNHK